ncbi:MAG: peptidylprolyl isomerase [Planctomycetota bacterium]|nr:peptidylprolyl isomerase [Planctomycetota bacterium]MDA0918011.1 peptidylprolyl isomerase [Planctomycetota bacterium]MDA1158046.1 peptidylprolyl isomerase [Planctomycetota bacterium]
MSCVKRSDVGAPPIPTAEATSGGVADETFIVRLETSKGDIDIEVHPAWAPKGAERFRKLVEIGFYDECRFFRVDPNFMVQVGMNGDPALHAKWSENTIKDDPVLQSNLPGFVTFAKTGLPNSRSTQFFINYKDNSQLDADRFAPFGKVVSGMDVALAIEAKYRELPDQNAIRSAGNDYLKSQFPDLDFIKKASVVQN